MRIASLVFSPAGKTLETAKRFEEAAGSQGLSVRTVDWTRSQKVFRERCPRGFLEQEVPPHDVLCVFSPVYVHHLPDVCRDLLRHLPAPKGKWGLYALPVVTFGGGSSGSALLEAARVLFRSKRLVVGALKVEAEHCITRVKPILTKINVGKPGEELDPVLKDLAVHLNAPQGFGAIKARTVLAQLNYQSPAAQWKNRLLFRQSFWQRRIYPKLGIDRALCISCGVCEKVCAVQCLEMTADGPLLDKSRKRCLHCATCVTACPSGALQFQADWDHWNRVVERLGQGRGALCTEEKPNTRLFVFGAGLGV